MSTLSHCGPVLKSGASLYVLLRVCAHAAEFLNDEQMTHVSITNLVPDFFGKAEFLLRVWYHGDCEMDRGFLFVVGYEIGKNRMSMPNLCATIVHRLGLDHNRVSHICEDVCGA